MGEDPPERWATPLLWAGILDWIKRKEWAKALFLSLLPDSGWESCLRISLLPTAMMTLGQSDPYLSKLTEIYFFLMTAVRKVTNSLGILPTTIPRQTVDSAGNKLYRVEGHPRVSQGIPGHPRASQGTTGHPRVSQGIPGHPRASQGILSSQGWHLPNPTSLGAHGKLLRILPMLPLNHLLRIIVSQGGTALAKGRPNTPWGVWDPSIMLDM